MQVLECASEISLRKSGKSGGNYHVGIFAARMLESLIRELPEKDQLRSTFHELKHV